MPGSTRFLTPRSNVMKLPNLTSLSEILESCHTCKTLCYPGKVCKGLTLWLITKIFTWGRKKFYNIGFCYAAMGENYTEKSFIKLGAEYNIHKSSYQLLMIFVCSGVRYRRRNQDSVG
jgi:hypothetical protein